MKKGPVAKLRGNKNAAGPHKNFGDRMTAFGMGAHSPLATGLHAAMRAKDGKKIHTGSHIAGGAFMGGALAGLKTAAFVGATHDPFESDFADKAPLIATAALGGAVVGGLGAAVGSKIGKDYGHARRSKRKKK